MFKTREPENVAAPMGPDQLIPSGGRALEPVVQRKMESSLGADLSDVRVHTDDGRASAMNAEAYTVGSDIVFGNGNYDPSSQAGARRLAHELTHVTQQRAGAVSGEDLGNGVAVSHPSDSFERAAEDNADRMMGGAPPARSFTGGGGASGASVQRVVQREESDTSSGVWDKLKDGAKKLLGKAGRLGGVAAPVVESADGLRKLAQADSGVDRTLAAEDGIKGVAGDTVGGAVVDAKRKLFPFQGDVDASGTGMSGDVTGGNPATDAPMDAQGNRDAGDQIVTESGEIIDKRTGETDNAGDDVLTPEVKKQLDDASAAGQ